MHNRKPMTLRCLAALRDQDVEGVDLSTVLFDDGSTDGTATAVAEEHPSTTVLRGDGSFFWNGGMRVALAHAVRDEPDFLLWMNDDTVIHNDALRNLLAAHDELMGRGEPPAVIVATVVDPRTGEVNYSGRRQDPVRRMAFDDVRATDRPVKVDTMNGNCVLVPRAVYAVVGNLEPTFTHSMGDYDYGLRVSAAGFGVWVAPGIQGTCPSNPGFVPEVGGGVRQEFSRLRGTKHLPPSEWRVFVQRWGGVAWPAFWISPYLRRLVWIVRSRISR